MKKKQLIENKLNELQEYCTDQKFPLAAKIPECRKKFTIEQVVALVQRFLVPAHESKCLKEYVLAEFERLKLVLVAEHNAEEILKWHPTDEQADRVIEILQYIITVIEL